MAILKAELKINLEPILKLLKLFPEFNGSFLALIGKRARNVLKNEFLSGQELNLRAFPKDKAGRYTIISDVNKNRTQTKIYSYPVNLFERGRRLRSGRKEAGKFIVTRKLKQVIMSRMTNYVQEFERKILDKEIKKADL